MNVTFVLTHDRNRPTFSGAGSFDGVLRGLGRMVQQGNAFETISVVIPSRVRELASSVGFLFERGAQRASINPCDEAAWTDADRGALQGQLVQIARVVAT